MRPVRISTKGGTKMRVKIGTYPNSERVIIDVFDWSKKPIWGIPMTPAETRNLIAALESALKEVVK